MIGKKARCRFWFELIAFVALIVLMVCLWALVVDHAASKALGLEKTAFQQDVPFGGGKR